MCAICLNAIEEGAQVKYCPRLDGHGEKHVFHAACVDRWVASKRSCPTCRHHWPTS